MSAISFKLKKWIYRYTYIFILYYEFHPMYVLSTFCVCLHHTQFIPHSFILVFCRDFRFVTALWMPEENQKLHILSNVLLHSL